MWLLSTPAESLSARLPATFPDARHSRRVLQDINLQNQDAWNDLGKEKDNEGENDGEGDDGDEENKDMLWDEFKSREQEEEQRVPTPLRKQRVWRQ